MSKEYFLECLADPWIFQSLGDFQSMVQEGGILPSDGSGTLLFVNKKTLQLEEGGGCFYDGLDVWKSLENENPYGGLASKTIERIIKHFSTNEKQLIGVMWYNK